MILEFHLASGDIGMIDLEDRNVLYGNKWVASPAGKTKYAYRGRGANKEYMHRMIVGASRGQFVDHIDGNGLNNTRANLRLCTKQQNAFNMESKSNSASGYKGVTKHRDCRWQARIMLNGKNLYLGLFPDSCSAAMAYDEAAVKHFGEFARLNFK